MLKYSELENHEVVEIATSIKVLTSVFEKEHHCPASTIFFREYTRQELGIDTAISQEDRKAFILMELSNSDF